HLVVVLRSGRRPGRIGTPDECSQHRKGVGHGLGSLGGGVGVFMQVLETKAVQRLGAEHLRVTNLHGMFVAVGVKALRSKAQLPDSAIGGIVVEKLIANREDIVGTELKVSARTQVGQGMGSGDGLVERSRGERGAGAENISGYN